MGIFISIRNWYYPDDEYVKNKLLEIYSSNKNVENRQIETKKLIDELPNLNCSKDVIIMVEDFYINLLLRPMW